MLKHVTSLLKHKCFRADVSSGRDPPSVAEGDQKKEPPVLWSRLASDTDRWSLKQERKFRSSQLPLKRDDEGQLQPLALWCKSQRRNQPHALCILVSAWGLPDWNFLPKFTGMREVPGGHLWFRAPSCPFSTKPLILTSILSAMNQREVRTCSCLKSPVWLYAILYSIFTF